jgi:hypothetical protein
LGYIALIIYLYYETSHIGWLGGLGTGIGLLFIFLGMLCIIGYNEQKKSDQNKPRQKQVHAEDEIYQRSRAPHAVDQHQQCSIDKSEAIDVLEESIEDLLFSAEKDQAPKPLVKECVGCGYEMGSEATYCEYCERPV